MSKPPLVCIESPFAGDAVLNVAYADVALLHSLERGETPFAGHLLYTRVLDDFRAAHRELGISCHLQVLARCDLVALYCDLGISRGMQLAIDAAERFGVRVESRELGVDWRTSLLAKRVSRSAGI